MQAVEVALSTLFVPRCAACEARVEPPAPLCAACATTVDELGPACPRCGEPQAAPPAVECARCRAGRWPLEAMVAPWRYGGELGRSLRRLKFARRHEIARALAPLYAPFLLAAVEAGAIDLIVPIPLHWRRLAARGFNQSEALARHARAAAGCAAPLDTRALRRVRNTSPQTHLDGDARRLNLLDAFAVPRPARVAGRRVLLVDDVVATGATMAAAAAALTASGAAGVVGFAFARAER